MKFLIWKKTNQQPGIKVHNGNSTNQAAEQVEKVKFPQELFPECRWSRKGFMRTRWLFDDYQPLDLVNIHLFHDASNLIAMETTPSPYAQNRQRALEFTLERISAPLNDAKLIASQDRQSSTSNEKTEVPLFIFGDFNFRLDTNKVIQRITEGVPPVVKRSADSNEVLEFIYHRRPDDRATANNSTSYVEEVREEKAEAAAFRKEEDGRYRIDIEGGGVVMTVGKKLFDCENLDETFRATKNTEWLLELDNELDSFKSQLLEFKISFSPSYPFKEDKTGGYSYMKTRCPAWCDRILFNVAGSNMIYSENSKKTKQDMNSEKRIELLQREGDIMYRLMGSSVPMGDHKPVLLYCRLDLNSNNINQIDSDATIDETSSTPIESTAM